MVEKITKGMIQKIVDASVTKEIAKKRAPGIIKWLIIDGIIFLFIGWSLCHFYVNKYGASFPNVSIFKFALDMLSPKEIFIFAKENPESFLILFTGLWRILRKRK